MADTVQPSLVIIIVIIIIIIILIIIPGQQAGANSAAASPVPPQGHASDPGYGNLFMLTHSADTHTVVGRYKQLIDTHTHCCYS